MTDLSTPDRVMARPPLCGCGCGQPVNFARRDDRANGYVKGQPFKYLRGHHPNASSPAYVAEPETGCWIWQRSTMQCGYGKLSRFGKHWLAHRWFYTRAKGEIPDGLQLDHLCRNRTCVNPEHLEPVTSAENTRRGTRVKLSAAQAAEIRASTEDAKVVAARFGIARSTVYNIRGGHTWAT